MAEQRTDGSVAFESSRAELELASGLPEATLDWVDYRCPCPDCGAEVSGFRTKDLCNTLDTVDYRIAYHFYAECECGAWIDFIRKAAKGIEDFDVHVEKP